MVLNVILGVTVFVLVCLFICFLTGKGKPSDQRSTFEKLACTVFSIFMKNVDDATNSLRTARVMKDEALREVNEAIRNLKQSYKEGQVNMQIALRKLNDEILPNLKDQPGKLESKARKAKNDYQKSVESGTPIEAYKENALKYLSLKNKAMTNIKRAEDNVKKLTVAIETSKARYDGNIIDLEMIKSELESVIDIPQIELNNSLNRIHSLQSELTERMNIEEIRTEVETEIREDNTSTYSADLNSEFDNL